MLSSGDFEANPESGWRTLNTCPNCGISRLMSPGNASINALPRGGSQLAQVTLEAAASPTSFGAFSPDFTLILNRNYRLSGWVFLPANGQGCSARFYFQSMPDSNNLYAAFDSIDSANTRTLSSK